MVEEPSPRTKALACAALVAISTLVGFLYKSTQASGGGFKYSTLSAITIAECIKFVMSCTFYFAEKKTQSALSQLSVSAVAHIWFLSFLYSFNNQLSFYVYTLADPGTIFLFKSASMLIVATVQTGAGKAFSAEQWRAMGLQALGMVIVQYDPCRSRPIYSARSYMLMGVSTTITAVCAARNEYLVKNFKISLNVQNATLYLGGALMNLAAFFLVPNPNDKQASIGFFDGYDNLLAIGVVFANSLIGIVITAVYKYADAIIKCIASDITAVNLCAISIFMFGLKSSITLWCGVGVVCFAVHLYTVAPKPAMSGSASAPTSATKPAEKTKSSPAEAGNSDSVHRVTKPRSFSSMLVPAVIGLVSLGTICRIPVLHRTLLLSSNTQLDCVVDLIDQDTQGSVPVQDLMHCLGDLASNAKTCKGSASKSLDC